MKSTASLLLVATVALGISGCASYRTDSNITTEHAPPVSANTPVLIVEGPMRDRKYRELGPIEVSVKKLTLFHADPTKAQANEALVERARAIGAHAVINVTYESGVGFTTWGYMDAKGMAVKFEQ